MTENHSSKTLAELETNVVERTKKLIMTDTGNFITKVDGPWKAFVHR